MSGFDLYGQINPRPTAGLFFYRTEASLFSLSWREKIPRNLAPILVNVWRALGVCNPPIHLDWNLVANLNLLYRVMFISIRFNLTLTAQDTIDGYIARNYRLVAAASAKCNAIPTTFAIWFLGIYPVSNEKNLCLMNKSNLQSGREFPSVSGLC